MTHRIYSMALSAGYPHYVAKVEKKGRTEAELREVIRWLTGYSDDALATHLREETTFRDFFAGARLNPAASAITGVICGVRVEEIEDPLMQQIRYLDKLVDELARGKAMEKVLRDPLPPGDSPQRPTTIDAYLDRQPEPHRALLERLRGLINEEVAAAGATATETIAWGMPTWKLNGNLLHLAAAKHHVGVHPGADGVEFVADEADRLGLKRSKGTIRIPLDTDVPDGMLRRLVRFRVEAQQAKG